MTNFSDLPFELRYNIFRINTEKAFESKIKRFSRLYEKLCKPKMYVRNIISGLSTFEQIDKGVTTIITNDYIRHIYAGQLRMNNIFCYGEVKWLKNEHVWNNKPVIIISKRYSSFNNSCSTWV